MADTTDTTSSTTTSPDTIFARSIGDTIVIDAGMTEEDSEASLSTLSTQVLNTTDDETEETGMHTIPGTVLTIGTSSETEIITELSTKITEAKTALQGTDTTATLSALKTLIEQGGVNEDDLESIIYVFYHFLYPNSRKNFLSTANSSISCLKEKEVLINNTLYTRWLNIAQTSEDGGSNEKHLYTQGTDTVSGATVYKLVDGTLTAVTTVNRGSILQLAQQGTIDSIWTIVSAIQNAVIDEDSNTAMEFLASLKASIGSWSTGDDTVHDKLDTLVEQTDTIYNEVTDSSTGLSAIYSKADDTYTKAGDNFDLLDNSTYGLEAIKDAVDNIPTTPISGYALQTTLLAVQTSLDNEATEAEIYAMFNGSMDENNGIYVQGEVVNSALYTQGTVTNRSLIL